MISQLICILSLLIWKAASYEIVKPNIVFIMADDMGWDDVSFHGSDQIMTPNIDVLAYEGQILSQYYTDTQGTPSRSAMFTGKYPHKLGTIQIQGIDGGCLVSHLASQAVTCRAFRFTHAEYGHVQCDLRANLDRPSPLKQSVYKCTHGSSIKGAEDRGIPTSEQLLPEYLRKLGYQTHLIGKWHVGKSREHYLPTVRGFDAFYGFLGGSADYYTFNLVENYNESSYFGLDFWDNDMPLVDQTGYLTDLITSRAVKTIREHNTSSPLYLHVSHAAPHTGGGLVSLQPALEDVAANIHIAHSARRLYAGLITSLDKSIGQIVLALAERDLIQNTLIIFVSDNGASTIGDDQNFGSNLPLRGVKNSPWEGAARSIGVMWHASMTPGTYQGIFHVTDWLPTLVTVAGGNINGTKGLDGVNQWDSITKGEPSKRKDALITIDDQNGWAAFREGDFKLIVGNLNKRISEYVGMDFMDLRLEVPSYETLLLESDTLRVMKETLDIDLNLDQAFETRNLSNLLLQITPPADEKLCIPTKEKGCLFNITEDPLESRDLWNSSPQIVRRMTLRLRSMWTEIKPRHKFMPDPKAKPSRRNYTWSPWVPNDALVQEPPKKITAFPLLVSMDELQYLIDLNLNSFKDRIFDSITNMGKSFVKSFNGLF